MVVLAALVPVPEPRVADNAATYYVLAADHIHNLWSYQKDELDKVLAVPLDAPPHPDLGKWLEAFDRPLVYLHRGANCRACVWLHTAAQPTNPVATLSGDALNTSRVSALAVRRAQVRFAASRSAEAVADLRAVLRLAHFQSHGGTVGAWIMGNVTESLVRDYVAANMGRLPPASAAALWDIWQALPPAAPAEAVIANEWRALRGFLARTLEVGPSPAADGFPDHALDPQVQTLAKMSGTSAQAAFARMDATAARWAERDRAVTTATPATVAGLAEQRRADIDANTFPDDIISHSLFKMVGPNAAGLRRAEFRNVARRAMVLAALDARATGQPPKAGRDAFGHAYQPWPLAGGYVLVSAARDDAGRSYRLPIRTSPARH